MSSHVIPLDGVLIEVLTEGTTRLHPELVSVVPSDGASCPDVVQPCDGCYAKSVCAPAAGKITNRYIYVPGNLTEAELAAFADNYPELYI